MRLHFLAALVCLLPSLALAQDAAQPPGLRSGGLGDASNQSVTATDGSVSRFTRDLAGDTINVRSFGAKGDGRRANAVVTIDAGSAALTVGSSLFSAADIGKVIAIPGAGVTPTTGPLVTTPVASAGAGYQSVPSVAYSGTGTGAVGTVFMALQSASVAAGGAGCSNGTQTFTVMGGLGDLATVTGTVSGGALSGALTIVSGGDYGTLPLNLTGALLSGLGCTTLPTASLSFGVGRVSTAFADSSGYDGATTASLSGGSPNTAATLGTPTVSLAPRPLVAKITAVPSATQVTLDVAASTAVSGAMRQVFWATDDRAAIQKAIDVLTATNRRVLYFPAGVYFKAYGAATFGAPLDPGTSTSITFKGDGPEASVIVWDGGTAFNAGGDGALFRQPFGTAGAFLTFQDLQFRGFLDLGRVNVGGPAFYLNYFGGVSFDRSKFFQHPWMAMQIEGAGEYSVTNSVFDAVLRDQARCRTCSNVRIALNRFSRSDDDSVALHQSFYTTALGQGRRSLVVTGNIFEDTTGIAILGGREGTVTGNICRRAKIGCVRVLAGPSEAYSPTYAMTVANNQAFDTLGRAPFSGSAYSPFQVSVQTPRAGSGDANLYPGANNVSTGAVVSPYGTLDNNVTETTLPTPAAYGVSFINNRSMRTLPSVTAYSAWGFGLPMTSLGPMDFRVSEAVLRPTTGIDASANIVSLRMAGNDVLGARRCLTVSGDPVSPAFARHRVEGNTCFDTWEYGLFYSGATTGLFPHVTIRGNEFVLDPYRMSPGRAAFGSWVQNYGASVGIAMPTSYGPLIQDNMFEELYQPIVGPFRPRLRDNAVKGQFLSLAWSAANYGVGTVPSSGAGYDVLQTGSRGTTAISGFMGYSQPKISEATAMPTVGYWQPGDFVRNTNPANTAVYGWSRLTSGTANVSGTDWKTVPLQ